jgi:hypothetical protein
MGNMSYCRHENTAQDLEDVWEKWDDFDPDEADDREKAGRARLLSLIKEMHDDLGLGD